MKVYVDVIFIINFLYDFLILSSVSILLKRNADIKHILFGCLIGISTMCTLFISLERIVLLLLKFITSLSMVAITFGHKRFLENVFYFYIMTIIIGGFQYLVTGDEYEVNLILMGILSPIIIGLYIKSQREYKANLNKLYNVVIVDGDNAYALTGYMDTGNTLKDPLTNYPVILVSKDMKFISKKYFYVPYKVVNSSSILKCLKVDKVLVDNKEVKVLLGLVENNLFSSGIDVILNESIREKLLC